MELAVSWGHTRPDGRSPFTAMDDAGYTDYTCAAENIYKINTLAVNAQRIVNAWMNSDGHRKNILNPAYDTLSVGVHSDLTTVYAVQMFAGHG